MAYHYAKFSSAKTSQRTTNPPRTDDIYFAKIKKIDSDSVCTKTDKFSKLQVFELTVTYIGS
jgi:hypothetical protein